MKTSRLIIIPLLIVFAISVIIVLETDKRELTDTDEFIEIPEPPVFDDSIVFQDAVWWFATLPDTFYTLPDGRRGAKWRDFDIIIQGDSYWMDSILNDIILRRISLFPQRLYPSGPLISSKDLAKHMDEQWIKYKSKGRGEALFMADGTRIETYFDSLGKEYRIYTRPDGSFYRTNGLGYRTKVPE